MNTYYHCFLCNNIPSIEISDDKVNIACSKKHEKTLTINDFCQNCIKQCQCENCVFYKNGKIEKCNLCSKKIRIMTVDFRINSIYNNFSEKNILYYNEYLNKFINEINLKIEETKNILGKIQNELKLYKSLIIKGRKFINREAIDNLKNLKIFTNIDDKKKFFINKMDEINNELKNFHNFEYKKDNYKFNNSYNYIHEPLKKITNIENKTDTAIFDNGEIKENELSKFFKNPEKPLLQIHGIKLEDIENRIKYITNKLVNISVTLEEIDINNRNKFLENVKNIGEESIKFSKELYKKLKMEFSNKYGALDKNENEKRVLSSWFNQSLIIDESNKNNKFKRYFFEYLCKMEINRIKDCIKIDSKWEHIFSKNNYNFEELFSDLTQLYTESSFYPEKVIELKKAENDNFISEHMKDITDLSGKKFVKYTVLPGLFANNCVIGKIIVFCENRAIFQNIKQIQKIYNYTCKIDTKLKNEKIFIEIKVYPPINGTDYMYELKFKNMGYEKFLYSGKENIFVVDKELKNQIAICTVYRNQIPICKGEKKLEINEPDSVLYIRNNPKKKPKKKCA